MNLVCKLSFTSLLSSIIYSILNIGAFDLLVYADDTIPVPPAWEESDAKLIAAGGDTVDFKTFSTKVSLFCFIILFIVFPLNMLI